MKKLFSLLTLLVVSQLFSTVSMAQTVPLADADKFFDFAEAFDPVVFGPPAETQQLNVLDNNWYLRVFSASSVTLAINADGTGPFFSGDVYALGGPFGSEPVFIDKLAVLLAFIDSVTADDDDDGVVNADDQCEDTPPGETVNSQGCSASQLDDDGDGVSDAQDQCPDTPAGEPVDSNGCGQSQLDDDNDGVSNADDACPATQPGQPVNADGCSAMQLGIVVSAEDADKLFDFAQMLDAAAFGPPTATEIIENQGIQWYSRTYANSGISIRVSIDGFDPFLAGNVYVVGGTFGDTEVFIDTLANLVAAIDAQQPPDSDNDGVPDDMDQCPGTPAGEAANGDGCSESQLGDDDSDNDGVNNNVDQCPATPAGQSVNAQGCSDTQLDTDGDGVNNAEDQCPATPAGQPVDAQGCSSAQLDSDGDGVSNAMDQCPDTPAGQVVDAQGCSSAQLDIDGDGVNNISDQCPDTPAGETVNAQGCSDTQLDSDFDGVSDAADLCPATPLGQSVNADGCSSSQLDSDGDGVNDNADLCPDTPAGEAVNAEGCSDSQQNGGVQRSDVVLNEGTGACAAGPIPVVGAFGSYEFRVLFDGSLETTSVYTEEILEVTDTTLRTQEVRPGFGGFSETVTETTETFEIVQGLRFKVENVAVSETTTTFGGMTIPGETRTVTTTYNPSFFESPLTLCIGMELFYPSVLESILTVSSITGQTQTTEPTVEVSSTVEGINEPITVAAGSFDTLLIVTEDIFPISEDEEILATIRLWTDNVTGLTVKIEVRDEDDTVISETELVELTQ